MPASGVADLIEEKIALEEQLRWAVALLAITVELEGGQIVLNREVVESYPLTTQVRIEKDEVSDTYVLSTIIEGEIVE